MPAEWKLHDGIWLQWPRNKDEPGHVMEQEHTWLKMVAAPYQHETVYIITSDEQQRDHVVYQLDYFGIGPDGFENQIIANFDVGAWDNGPIFIVNDQGDLAITDWNFNGW